METTTRRLSKDEWLARALEATAKRGVTKLRIDALVASLGVTKGSFYWHFRDREDFVKSLAQYWARTSTDVVVEELSRAERDPRVQMRRLMELVVREDLSRYDLAMRTLATQEPGVAAVVRRVDRTRMATVRSLFAEMGYRGRELETRTRIFVGYMSLEHGIYPRESKKERLASLEDRFWFFTRR